MTLPVRRHSTSLPLAACGSPARAFRFLAMLSDMLGKIQAFKQESARNREMIIEKQRARDTALAEKSRLLSAKESLAVEVGEIRDKARAMTGRGEGLQHEIGRRERMRVALVEELKQLCAHHSEGLLALEKEQVECAKIASERTRVLREERFGFMSQCADATIRLREQQTCLRALEEETGSLRRILYQGSDKGSHIA